MKMRAPKGEGALTSDDLDGQTQAVSSRLPDASCWDSRSTASAGSSIRSWASSAATDVYVELQRHLLRDEEADNRTLIDLAGAFHVPVVATNGVRFADPAERPLFDVLTCIHHKTDVSRRPAGSWRAMPSGI